VSDLLAEIRADLIEYNEKHWPRSKQTVLGASDTYGCRARGLLKLLGIPPSEQKMSWPANVGNSIDEWVGRARTTVRPERLAQVRVRYRGVPCTVDEYDPVTKALTDWKSKDDAAKVSDVRRYGPDESQRGQVMIGAAGLIEAGHEVERVRLCFMPRNGDLEDGYVWEAPFSRQEADAAADWHAEQLALRDEMRESTPEGQVPVLDGLRDKPSWWCGEYCEWFQHCRGLRRDLDPADDETKELASQFLTARADMKDAEDRRDYFRRMLSNLDRPVEVEGQRVNWTGGGRTSKEVIDQEELLAAFRTFVGEPPMTRVTSTSSRSLRVTKAKQ
jgi:hypothetical protein